jgi:lipoprotein NlpI
LGFGLIRRSNSIRAQPLRVLRSNVQSSAPMKSARLATVFAMLFAVGAIHAQSISDTLQCEKARELPERAISSCTRVIDSGQFSGINLAIAFHNRGIARTGMGEHDAAIADLDRAILINPNAAGAFTSRGIAWHSHGDFARAIVDYDAALRMNPRDFSVANHRGQARYFLGEFALAARDFSLAARLSKPDAYIAIWSYLARTRNGEDARSEFEQAVRQIPAHEWPAPVLRAYLGDISPEAALLAAAHADPRKQVEQRCETYYYLGQWRVIRSEQEQAVINLRSAQSQCPTTFLEYTGATAELKRLR